MAIIVLVFYMCFVGAIAWSAIRHRREGWKSGLVLAILLASLPLWVIGLNLLFQWLAS